MRRFLTAFLMVFTATAYSATDGTEGATSTGSSVISVTIPKLIVASSFADFAFGSYGGVGDLNSNDDLVVSGNYLGTYQVTASGSGVASAFTITDGLQTIAYNVNYNDASGIVGAAAMTSGTALTAQSGLNASLGSAVSSGNLNIVIPEANLQAVSSGSYTGTVTLVFQPE